MTEAEGAAVLEGELRRRDLAWYHTHDSRRSAEGFPDYVIPVGRWILFVEIKCHETRGELTKAQADWLLRLRGPWRISIVADVSALPSLMMAIDNAKAGRLDAIGPAGVKVLVLGEVRRWYLLGSEADGEVVRRAAAAAGGSTPTPSRPSARGSRRSRRGS